MRNSATAIAAAISALGLAAPATAATPLSVRDSFRIGTSGTIFCSAQSMATDAVLRGMFDAGYTVTCKDAALPVVLHHNTPNNSISLLWADTTDREDGSKRHALFPRYERHHADRP